MTLSVQDLAQQYGQAWASHDVDAIVALHAADSVFHVHGLTDPATGRESVGQTISAMLGYAPDLHFETKRAYLGPDHIVLEYVMSGTVGASSFACDGVDVIMVADGLVSRKDTYLDLRAYDRQDLPQVAVG